MLVKKLYKHFIVNLLIMALIQFQITYVTSLFLSGDVLAEDGQTTNTDQETSSNDKPDHSGSSAGSRFNLDVDESRSKWADVAIAKKQEYILPASEIARLEKQAVLNKKIAEDNERLINKFASAVSALGIDIMADSADLVESLTTKLVTSTKDLENHTKDELKPAIEDFENASNIPLIPPVGGIIGMAAWVGTGPKANSEVEQNNNKADEVFDDSKNLWKAIDDMVMADNASYLKALNLAQSVKNEALDLLKTGVNDEFALTKAAVTRTGSDNFKPDMVTNANLLGVSAASCLDLDCSNLGDAFSVSYHLFKAASAIYLSTKIRLINAYNQNEQDIIDSRPAGPDEEQKFDDQTEQLMIAGNVKGENVDFGSKIRASKAVLKAQWEWTTMVAKLELRQKQLRELAELAQGSGGGGAAQAMKDAADLKDQYADDSKDWIIYVGISSAVGIGMCCHAWTACQSFCSNNVSSSAKAGVLGGGIIYTILQMTMGDQDNALDALDEANKRGGGGGGGGQPESATHMKLACNAAGDNLYVGHQSSGKKITTALGIKESDLNVNSVFNLFRKIKVKEARDMSQAFGDPLDRFNYLSQMAVVMAQKAIDLHDKDTTTNLTTTAADYSGLSDDMKVFGDNKTVGATGNDTQTSQKDTLDASSADTSGLAKMDNLSGSSTIGALGGNANTKSIQADKGNNKTKSMGGGGNLQKLANKLNAMSDKYTKKRMATRRKLGLKASKRISFDAKKFADKLNNDRAQTLNKLSKMAGMDTSSIQDLIAKFKKHGGNVIDDDANKKKGKVQNWPGFGDTNFKKVGAYSGAFRGGGGDADPFGENGNQDDANGTGDEKDLLAEAQRNKEYLDEDAYNKEKHKYSSKSGDSLWIKITKTYKRSAYPTLLKKRIKK